MGLKFGALLSIILDYLLDMLFFGPNEAIGNVVGKAESGVHPPYFVQQFLSSRSPLSKKLSAPSAREGRDQGAKDGYREWGVGDRQQLIIDVFPFHL